MALEGIRADPDDVIVTVGSQMALDLVTRIFFDPGDVMLAEAPSYVGALGSFAAYQAAGRARRDGRRTAWCPSALRAALETVRPAGGSSSSTRSRTSTTRPASRCPIERRAEVARDLPRSTASPSSRTTPTGCWASTGTPTRALRSIDPDNVVYLGSFSKTFAAGLRVGWVLAPHAVREKLVLAAESATLYPPSFNQMLVSRYLAAHDWRGQVKAYSRPTATAATPCCRVGDQMPAGCTWTRPRRRLLRVADPARGRRHEGDAARARSLRGSPTCPGTGFYADGLGSRQLRLSYCYPTPERITEGVRRLAGVLAAELDVLRTFGSPARPAVGRGPQSPSPSTP